MRTKVHGRLRAILLSIVMLVSLGTVVLGPVSVANADPICADNGAYTLFVRGSGERFDDLRAAAFKRATMVALGLRGLSSQWAELGNLDGNYEVQDAKHEYPATRVDDYHVLPPFYGSSIRIGTDELIKHLNDRVSRCPYEAIILGGYSQGADVIGWALERTGYGALNATTRSHIAYVALFGDPRFNSEDWPGCLLGKRSRIRRSSKTRETNLK